MLELPLGLGLVEGGFGLGVGVGTVGGSGWDGLVVPVLPTVEIERDPDGLGRLEGSEIFDCVFWFGFVAGRFKFVICYFKLGSVVCGSGWSDWDCWVWTEGFWLTVVSIVFGGWLFELFGLAGFVFWGVATGFVAEFMFKFCLFSIYCCFYENSLVIKFDKLIVATTSQRYNPS